jgi:prepilin-type N-terminal cleavage/methylation domain-containing protein
MNNIKIKNNKGFSLIELSIVLIIIGLLVAGITGGASLIKSAELRSIMTEARSYKIAISTYYASQDALPGDDDNSNIGTTVGNSNRKIEANINISPYTNESVEAWHDMSDDKVGILELSLSNPPSGAGDETQPLTANMLASSKVKGGGWTIDYSTEPFSGGSRISALNKNGLILTAPTEAEGGVTETTPTAILTGLQVYQIDKKMDNSDLQTGSVIAMDANLSGAGGNAQVCDETKTATVCGIFFKIGL